VPGIIDQHIPNHLPRITFPLGAAGNQLRWLLYLNSIFSSIDGGNKIEFIKQQVYPAHRTWNNWLYHEWAWRKQLNSVMPVTHIIEKPPDKQLYLRDGATPPPGKWLYLTVQDLELPYLHYFHLNLGNNYYHFDTEARESKLQKWAKDIEPIKTYPNIKVVYCDSLFKPTLSREFYSEVVDFFNLENHYNDAAIIQELYHQCRTNSMKEFYEYFTGSDFNKYTAMIKQKFLNDN
jgi:hypothetical protein